LIKSIGLALLLFLTAAYSSVNSRINKYELSYTTFDTLTDTNDHGAPFYSYPSNFEKIPRANFFTAYLNDHTLLVNIHSIVSEATSFKDNSIFGSLGATIDYSWNFLQAYIDFTTYTTGKELSSVIPEIQFERFILGTEVPITGVFDFRSNLSEAWLKAAYKGFSLKIGKDKLRWGPGYKGTLALSGTTYSSFYLYHIKQSIGRAIQVSSFLCSYDDEANYRKELKPTGTITIPSAKTTLLDFPPRYGAGQRLDLRIKNFLQIAVYELVDFFGSSDLGRFANPLQVYYLANNASGTNYSNLLAGIDCNIIYKSLRFYGEFLNDDITVMEHAGNPNKYAFQIGCQYTFNKAIQSAGMEYTHVSPYTYGHYTVLSRHALWNQSLGWPWGNDQDVFNAHANFSIIKDKLSSKLECTYWIFGKGTIKSDWYADGSPNLDHAPYWPQNASRKFSILWGINYRPCYWINLDFYYNPIIEKNKMYNAIYLFLSVDIPGKKVVRR
jgi:hypothetical protein